VVTKIFIFGCLTIIPAAILEGILMKGYGFFPRVWQPVYHAFVVAALVEEGIKFILIKRLSPKIFDEISDGMVYAMAAGLGFAFFENVVYGMRGNGSTLILVLRAFTAVPLHCIASGLMGYYLGLAWYDRRRSGIWGLILAIAFHGFYDYILFSPRIPDWTIVLLLPFGFIWIAQLFKSAQRLDKKYGLPQVS
jgi:RsiW-degrading membrane proteinase PrsW (M82 family)